MSIVIVDYGLGNLLSVSNMIRKAGGKSEITADPRRIGQAKKIVLPGVGHFAKGIANLNSSGIADVLKARVREHVPLLGICLGMQLLTEHSEEGNVNGLGLIPLKTRRFQFADKNRKIPHMGWEEIEVVKNHPYLSGFAEEPRFYFVHSYYVDTSNDNFVVAISDYGGTFASVIVNNNVVGMQFHPEKSHKFGLQVFKNFLKE